MPKKYETSPLAQLRLAAGLNQNEAAAALGYKWKQHLSHIENGRVMASRGLLERMAKAYKVTQREILEASVKTWARGVMSRRHRARRKRLEEMG